MYYWSKAIPITKARHFDIIACCKGDNMAFSNGFIPHLKQKIPNQKILLTSWYMQIIKEGFHQENQKKYLA